MSKRQQVKPAQPKRRIFPNDYTREDLVAELITTGAENYRLAEQIEGLTRLLRELKRGRR